MVPLAHFKEMLLPPFKLPFQDEQNRILFTPQRRQSSDSTFDMSGSAWLEWKQNHIQVQNTEPPLADTFEFKFDARPHLADVDFAEQSPTITSEAKSFSLSRVVRTPSSGKGGRKKKTKTKGAWSKEVSYPRANARVVWLMRNFAKCGKSLAKRFFKTANDRRTMKPCRNSSTPKVHETGQ